jgi:hypothetical protein
MTSLAVMIVAIGAREVAPGRWQIVVKLAIRGGLIVD